MAEIMAGLIPEDLIIEMLLRLPVEALLRFRCVSKRWRNLIDSPNFVKSQLNLPNKPQFVLLVGFDKKLRIYYFDYSHLDSDYIENPSPNFKELTLPLRDEILSNAFDFVGHCNGLLCFVCIYERSFLVLNPFTRKHIQVPPPEQLQCWWWAWGFGYDGDSDDYKIVALSFRNRGDDPCVVWIYSLKHSRWKNIVDFPYILGRATGVFVNGALHWTVRRCKRTLPISIIALNLGNLEYFSLPLPSDHSKDLFHLGVLDGRLCAIYDDRYGYDLWVMKEYGLKESWTRLGTYDGFYDDSVLLFVTYGDSVVQCELRSFWRKIWNTVSPIGKPLVYEPSLVWARSGI